jgi:hypothetical protein
MTRSDQESPVPEIGTPGLKRRGLETGRKVPRQSSTLLKTAKALGLTIRRRCCCGRIRSSSSGPPLFLG